MLSPAERQLRIDLYGNAYALLRDGLGAFPREMWQFRPAGGTWTIHEIILHIADSEANSFIRLRRLIAEPGTGVTAYDENAWARVLDYHSQSTDDALELFRWLRRTSYNLIRTLPETAWAHIVEHPDVGVMSMDDWLVTYARHVPDHLAQMAAVHEEWLTRPE